MWKVVVIALLSAICHIYALTHNNETEVLCMVQRTSFITVDYRLCQETPKEKHCLIEYSVRCRWPHQIRYVYNWHTRTCFEIRWSAHCHEVPSPAASNNFPSERECLDECGGWA